MMPLPCTVQKVETRKLVKVVDKEKEQEQYDLGSSIRRNQKLKGTCTAISYIVNNDLFPIVHDICI